MAFATEVEICGPFFLSSVALVRPVTTTLMVSYNFAPPAEISNCLTGSGVVNQIVTGSEWVLLRTSEGLCGWGRNRFFIFGPGGDTAAPAKVNVRNPLRAAPALLAPNEFVDLSAGPNFVLARINTSAESYFVVGWGSTNSSSALYELGRPDTTIVSILSTKLCDHRTHICSVTALFFLL